MSDYFFPNVSSKLTCQHVLDETGFQEIWCHLEKQQKLCILQHFFKLCDGSDAWHRRPGGREVKSIMFYSVSQLSAIALMHGIRRNGVPSFSPHKIVAMSAAKRGSMHIMLKGIEAGVQRNGVPRSLDVDRTVHACSETGFQPF